MNCPYPEHHSSGGGWGGPIAAILLAMVAAAILGPMLHLVVLALTIAGVVLLGGLVGLVLWHAHRRLSGSLPVWQRVPHLQPQRQRRQVPQVQQQAVEGGQHLHLHLDGLSTAERAEVMRQLRGGQ